MCRKRGCRGLTGWHSPRWSEKWNTVERNTGWKMHVVGVFNWPLLPVTSVRKTSQNINGRIHPGRRMAHKKLGTEGSESVYNWFILWIISQYFKRLRLQCRPHDICSLVEPICLKIIPGWKHPYIRERTRARDIWEDSPWWLSHKKKWEFLPFFMSTLWIIQPRLKPFNDFIWTYR